MSTVINEKPARERYEEGDLIGGKYRLSRQIGSGGMGSVWIATNLVLESRVAIKLLHAELRSPAVIKRFLREARSAAMLNHPSIVRIFDLGAAEDGDPFIVMELLGGESLGALLERLGPLAPERAVQLLLPVVAAIHVAHQHGVIHRDLKPDNIMIAETYGGFVELRVVDFGIAKLRWDEKGRRSTTGATLIGTPDYMAPEQARGLPVVDHRVDIWSFTTLLYETIAGKGPFTRDRLGATLFAVTDEPAPSLAGQHGVDKTLWAILERGLRKDPDERWPSMRALGEALATWLWSRGVREDACGFSLRAQWLRVVPTGPGRALPPPPSRRSLLMGSLRRYGATVGLALVVGTAAGALGASLVPHHDPSLHTGLPASAHASP